MATIKKVGGNSTPTLTDKIYVLTNGNKPLSYVLSNRHRSGLPLQFFDEKENILRPMRYATNQSSVFVDEQTGDALLGSIVFENGILVVPKTNPTLQKFLDLNPRKGIVYEELNLEEKADKELSRLDTIFEAQKASRELSLDDMENIGLSIWGNAVLRLSSSELKRDLRIYANENPSAFLTLAKDDNMAMKGLCIKALSKGIVQYKDGRITREGEPILTVPFGEDEVDCLARFLKTDKGKPFVKMFDAELG